MGRVSVEPKGAGQRLIRKVGTTEGAGSNSVLAYRCRRKALRPWTEGKRENEVHTDGGSVFWYEYIQSSKRV